MKPRTWQRTQVSGKRTLRTVTSERLNYFRSQRHKV